MPDFFKDQGLQIQGMHHLSPKEALIAIERGAALVDIRESYETAMKAFGVADVIYMPNSTLRDTFEQLPREKALIIADSVGLRSEPAVVFLLEHGFAHVANLNGGIADWHRDGLPTRADPAEMWTGSCACRLKPRKDHRSSR